MTNSQTAEKEILKILFDKKAITFSFDTPFVYVNGIKSPIYIDNRLLISYPKERKYVINALVDLIKNKN